MGPRGMARCSTTWLGGRKGERADRRHSGNFGVHCWGGRRTQTGGCSGSVERRLVLGGRGGGKLCRRLTQLSTRLFADSIVETSVSNLPDTALRSAWTLSRVDSCDNALVVFFTTLALRKTGREEGRNEILS